VEAKLPGGKPERNRSDEHTKTQSSNPPPPPKLQIPLPNRWGIAVCGVLIQMMLGTVYAWSVFKNPIFQSNHWDEFSVGVTFALTIFFLASLPLWAGGWWTRPAAGKWPPSAGCSLAPARCWPACPTGRQHLPVVDRYGVIAGIGNGLGYVTPVAVLTRWFPDKKGLITGLAVMGFGLGAAVMSLLRR